MMNLLVLYIRVIWVRNKRNQTGVDTGTPYRTRTYDLILYQKKGIFGGNEETD